MASKLALHISNQRAYVWNVEDLAVLRAQHHICGLLVGTLPHLSQQNIFLGVPLVLMPEEVVLLIEKELAILVDDANAHNTPSPGDLVKWVESRDKDIQQSLTRLEETKESAASKKGMTDEAMKKRREREETRSAARARAAGNVIEGVPCAISLEKSQPSYPTGNGTSTSTYGVVVPTTSTDLSWYNFEGHSFSTLAAAKAAGIWSYPVTLHERAKCGVFRDLWEKGYFMGGGLKFGGDFLVYPGDPLRYHSHFVATAIDSPISTLRPMQIVAFGRLGTATKKAHLLCGWDDDTHEVSYHSVEWAGFG